MGLRVTLSARLSAGLRIPSASGEADIGGGVFRCCAPPRCHSVLVLPASGERSGTGASAAKVAVSPHSLRGLPLHLTPSPGRREPSLRQPAFQSVTGPTATSSRRARLPAGSSNELRGLVCASVALTNDGDWKKLAALSRRAIRRTSFGPRWLWRM